MRIFSYRNKRLLKRTLLTVLLVLLGIAALVVCRFIYVGRFVTYDSSGAHLDWKRHLARRIRLRRRKNSRAITSRPR